MLNFRDTDKTIATFIYVIQKSTFFIKSEAIQADADLILFFTPTWHILN